MKNAIVVGASSGIGRALAKVLAAQGYSVGLAARRAEFLQTLAAELPTRGIVKVIDVSDITEAMQRLGELIDEMKDVELFVISSGTGFNNPQFEWLPEQQTIDVNVRGFAALANVAVAHLQARNSGCLVGISSVAALCGNADAPAYSASKAFQSIYLQSMRFRFAKIGSPILVMEAQPGFVDTDMAKADRKFWMVTAERAAEEIFTGIQKRRKHIYVTGRWRWIAWLIKLVPDVLMEKIQR